MTENDQLRATFDVLDDDQKEIAREVTRVIVQTRLGWLDEMELEAALLRAESDPALRAHIESVARLVANA